MQMLIFPALVASIAIVSGWPILFRKWRYWRMLWLVSNIIVVALGAWSMIYFQLERSYSRRAEADAVEATKEYLVSGADPKQLGVKLEVLRNTPEYQSMSLREQLRAWGNAAKLPAGESAR